MAKNIKYGDKELNYKDFITNLSSNIIKLEEEYEYTLEDIDLQIKEKASFQQVPNRAIRHYHSKKAG